jgi:hypothetical protein
VARRIRPASEIVPSYGWFGEQYTQVWRVMVNGCQVEMWTKQRQAKRALRRHLRSMRRCWRHRRLRTALE